MEIAAGEDRAVPSTRRRTKAANTALADEIERIVRANPGGLAGSERWL